MKYLKDNLTILIFGIILMLLGIVFVNIFSYFDPLRMCHIGIKGDILHGNEKTIGKALRLLKREDKASYMTVCKYVDDIGEKYCYGADKRVDGAAYGKNSVNSGCYIKGTRMIYLTPDKEEGEGIIRSRMEEIIKLANYSKKFWENEK